MRCRNCGHENDRNTGKCDNCGFSLAPQTDPGKDKRAAMQKPIVQGGNHSVVSLDLAASSKSKAGLIGLVVFLMGAAGALYIFSSFDRAVYEQESELAHEVVEIEIQLDSLPIILGTDIVYVFNAEGTSAAPRTNVDLALIPEGTTVSFLGSGSMSIQPVVNYMLQKINSNDFRFLAPDSLFAWVDSTETDYMAVSILPLLDDSAEVQPVELKILFTDEWFRCIVEEYNKDIVEPADGYGFDQRVFTRGMDQAVRTINR
ncbi:MAG: zinc ribbon domain-containing protein, partial [Candidatus Sabulitectum sp.]|nr:zinc ribbon domain-containing protein [Candidatus Sabulitectum sp.]